MNITVIRPNVHVTSVSSWGMVFTPSPSQNDMPAKDYANMTGKRVKEMLRRHKEQIIDIER